MEEEIQHEDDINWREICGWGEEHLEELRNTGFSYLRQGKYDTAEKFFRALVALDPYNAYDLQTLGALLLELDNTKEALEVLSEALKLQPNHSPTMLNQAKALLALGHKEEGLRIAKFLRKNRDLSIASMAKALIMGYS